MNRRIATAVRQSVRRDNLCLTLFIWVILLVARGSHIPETSAQEAVPQDHCIVELTLPEGTTVSVDGREFGAQRTFTFKRLDSGRIFQSKLVVTFPDRRQQAYSLLIRGGWRVPLVVAAPDRKQPELVLQTGHADSITSATLSPDGRRLVTGSFDRTAIIWDLASGNQLQTLRAHDVINSVAFDSTGSRVIATAGLYKSGRATNSFACIVWDAATGKELCRSSGHRQPVLCAAFSPDGQFFVVGSSEGTAILTEASSGKRIRTLHQNESSISCVAFSPDGSRILTGSGDGTVMIWDTRTGETAHHLRIPNKNVRSSAFSPDGSQVIVGAGQTVVVWNVTTGQELHKLEGKGYIRDVLFSSEAASALMSNATREGGFVERLVYSLWNVSNGRMLWETNTIDRSGITLTSATPNGHQLLIIDSNPELWDVQRTQVVRTFGAELQHVEGILSPDGRYFLASREAGVKPAGRELLLRLREFHGLFPSCLHLATFSPDGEQILQMAPSDDSRLILWDARTGEKLRDLPFQPEPEGNAESAAVVWNASTGRPVRVAKPPVDLFTWQTSRVSLVAPMAFSPDGRQLLLISGRDATLLDWQTDKTLHRFRGHKDIVDAVAFSPIGEQAMTGSRDMTAILWNTRTGQRMHTLSGHKDGIWSACFSPDGKLALTGSFDHTAMLWDAQTGQRLRVFPGHREGVASMGFSHDSQHVITVEPDGQFRIWNVATGRRVATVIHLVGDDWLVVTPDGFFDGSQVGMQKVSYRVGDGGNVVPVERFFQDFYRPGLLESIVRGQSPSATVEIGRQLPPKLRIVSPAAGSVSEREVQVVVEAVDQGGGVQGPFIFHQGARVLAGDTARREGDTVSRTYRIVLVEGENHLRVTAACADGSWESDPVELTLRYEKPLEKPSLHLVCVGVSSYRQGNFCLQFARSDAEAVARLFQRRGGALYQEIHIDRLLDEQATSDQISKTLRNAAQRAKPQDTLLLFLSGHGTMVGQRYYFIPWDFQTQADRSREQQVQQQGLPADVLAGYVASSPALKRVIVFDTCASGGAVELFQLASRNPFAFRGEIDRLSRSEGIHIIGASAATQEARESQDLGHGVLSYTLLAGLRAVDRGPLQRTAIQPQNPRQIVDVLEWFSFASGHVPRLTRELFTLEQHVHMSVRGESFPVLPLVEP